MSESIIETVAVRILEKDYQVNCPAEEVQALTESAKYLDNQMKTIRDSGKVLGVDRIAVMAALNIANEYLRNRDVAGTVTNTAEKKIQVLNEQLGQVLAEQKQLKL
jgi:cell division protein ZapA